MKVTLKRILYCALASVFLMGCFAGVAGAADSPTLCTVEVKIGFGTVEVQYPGDATWIKLDHFSQTLEAEAGTPLLFRATPDEGYSISFISVDNRQVPLDNVKEDGSLEFEVTAGEVASVGAYFTDWTPIDVFYEGGGRVYLWNGGPVGDYIQPLSYGYFAYDEHVGSKVRLYALPYEGCEIESILVNGQDVYDPANNLPSPEPVTGGLPMEPEVLPGGYTFEFTVTGPRTRVEVNMTSHDVPVTVIEEGGHGKVQYCEGVTSYGGTYLGTPWMDLPQSLTLATGNYMLAVEAPEGAGVIAITVGDKTDMYEFYDSVFSYRLPLGVNNNTITITYAPDSEKCQLDRVFTENTNPNSGTLSLTSAKYDSEIYAGSHMTVPPGTYTLTCDPYYGYHVQAVIIDGEPRDLTGKDTTLPVNLEIQVTGDMTYEVQFQPNSDDMATVDIKASGVIAGGGVVPVRDGESMYDWTQREVPPGENTFRAIPSFMCEIKSLIVDGQPINVTDPTKPFDFNVNVEPSGCTIEVDFKLIQGPSLAEVVQKAQDYQDGKCTLTELVQFAQRYRDETLGA